MSTKTTFKRTALVAVAALGLGILSTVSASATAATSGGAWSVTTAASGAGTTAGTQVVGGTAVVTFSDTATVTTAASVVAGITSSGVGTITAGTPGSTAVSGTAETAVLSLQGSPSGTVIFPTTGLSLSSSTFGNAATKFTGAFTVYSGVAGVQTLTATTYDVNGTPTATYTATITWGSAATASGQTSTAIIGKVAGTFPTTADATGLMFAPTAGAFAANIGVKLLDSSSNAVNGQAVSVTVSGPGSLGIQSGTSGGSSTVPTNTGRALSLSASTQASTNASLIQLYGDGTAGVSTITITAGSLTFTKTVTFYGSPAKVTATQNLYIAKAGAPLGTTGAATAATNSTVGNSVAVQGVVKDSGGNVVTGADVKIVSSNSSVIVAGSCVEETTDSPGTYDCQVSGAVGATSGATATVTFEASSVKSSGTYDLTATPLTFAIGGSIASMTLSTSAASYTPLAPIKLTVTAKDSAGNAAYDQDKTLLTSFVSSTALGGGTLTSPSMIINGVGSTATGIYAPSISGDFTISGTDNVSSAGEAVSVTATVAGGDTSAAVDAANAATDAANYAADAADAATTAAQEATAAAQAAQDSADAATAAVVALGLRVNVLMASVRAQLTSLSNLLVRIIKKTHA